jgi:hypothetical protein
MSTCPKCGLPEPQCGMPGRSYPKDDCFYSTASSEFLARRMGAAMDHVIGVMHTPPGARATRCDICGGTYGTHADGCTLE